MVIACPAPKAVIIGTAHDEMAKPLANKRSIASTSSNKTKGKL